MSFDTVPRDLWGFAGQSAQPRATSGRQVVRQTLALDVHRDCDRRRASWLLARGLEGLLFEVTAADPRTFSGWVSS